MLTVTDTDTGTELGAKVSELGQGQTSLPEGEGAILRAKAVRAVVMDYILATLEHDRLAYEWTEGPSGSDDTVEDDTARAAQLEAAMAAKSTAWVALCETFGVHP